MIAEHIKVYIWPIKSASTKNHILWCYSRQIKFIISIAFDDKRVSKGFSGAQLTKINNIAPEPLLDRREKKKQ